MRLLDFAQLARPQFKFDWFHELIFALLERCAEKDPEVENLLISLPPGSGKTELVMILFSAWLIAHNPLREHVIALSNADNLARMACANASRCLRQPDIAERFPLEFDKETESQFTVAGSDGRPAMYSASIMGQVTGARATALLYDDLVKNLEVAYSQPQLEKITDNFKAVAETRLVPGAPIVGIGTRWCLRDEHQYLIDHALANPGGRQITYLNLAAWNKGEDSYILNTRTGEKKFFPPYKALARVPGQPYSFTPKQWQGKNVDLGPNLWSALCMGNPLATDAPFFPAESWAAYDGVKYKRVRACNHILGLRLEDRQQQRLLGERDSGEDERRTHISPGRMEEQGGVLAASRHRSGAVPIAGRSLSNHSGAGSGRCLGRHADHSTVPSLASDHPACSSEASQVEGDSRGSRNGADSQRRGGAAEERRMARSICRRVRSISRSAR